MVLVPDLRGWWCIQAVLPMVRGMSGRCRGIGGVEEPGFILGRDGQCQRLVLPMIRRGGSQCGHSIHGRIPRDINRCGVGTGVFIRDKSRRMVLLLGKLGNTGRRGSTNKDIGFLGIGGSNAVLKDNKEVGILFSIRLGCCGTIPNIPGPRKGTGVIRGLVCLKGRLQLWPESRIDVQY